MTSSLNVRLTVLFVAALCLTARAAAAQSIQVVDATEKVYQADATLPSPSAAATLTAAQNEFEAFQIVVKGPATNVSLTAHALTGPGGAQIAPQAAGHQGNIMVYREAFFSLPGAGKATDPSAKEGNAPDALIPQYDEFYQEARNASVASVASGQNAVFFVDIQVPQAAAPGVYTGSVTVNYNGTTASVPVSLTVWPFALPSTPHLKSYIPFEWNAASTQYPSLAGKTAATIGQMHLLHAMEGVNNRVTIHAFDYGETALADYQATFGALVDGTAKTLLPGAHPTVLRYLGAHGTGNTLAAWKSFFSTNGWSNYLFDYVADEPAVGHNSTWCTLNTNAALAHAAGVRSITTTSIEQAKLAKCSTTAAAVNLTNVSVFIPTVDQVQPSSMATGKNSLADYASWRTGTLGGLGNEVWEYQSCDSWGCSSPGSATGWPSRAIDHSALRARALEWISFRNGITGEFYWDSTLSWTGLTQKPWTNQYSNGGNGDGTIIYPGPAANAQVGGTHDIPIGSLRLKMLREGVEDYEYLYLLSSLGDAAYGDAQIDAVFATAHSVTSATPDMLYTARKNLACRIIGDQHPGWTCDPASWTTTATTTPPATPVTPPAPPAPPTACTSTDCFDRADAVGLGPDWNSRSGLFKLVSNRATNTNVPSNNVSTWATPVGPDQDVSVDCTVADTGSNCGLVARWSDTNDFYKAALIPGSSAVQLIRTSAGTATVLGSATRTIAPGTAYRLRVVAQGTALAVYFNNETVPTISATDTAVTAGDLCGLYGGADAAQSVSLNNFSINSILYSASVVLSGTGSGLVTSNSGISCGAACSVPETSGASVTLTASPAAGSTFTGFTGACTGAATSCTFAVTGDMVVNAAFNAAAAPAPAPASSIAFRDRSTYVSRSTSTMGIALAVPATVHAGDALIANVFIGDYLASAAAPTITAPAGWTLLKTVKQGTAAVLAIYSKVAAATDPGHTYTWTTSDWVGSASSMLAYSGTNATAPVDASAALDNTAAGATYSTPSVTTTAPGDMLIEVYAGYANLAAWSAPAGATQRVKLNNAGLLSISNADLVKSAAGTAGAVASTSAPAQSYALTAQIALKH